LHQTVTSAEEDPNVYQITINIAPTGIYEAPPPPEPEPEPVEEELEVSTAAPPRINQPVAIVKFDPNSDAETTSVQPSISQLKMDEEGNLGMKFSSEMAWPDNWVAQAESDGRRLRRMRRLSGDQPLIMIGMEVDGVFESLGKDAVSIASLEPDNIKFKINFENPEILGLGSQFSPD